MAEKIGLICEGGGTKAAYTCGVLQCFLDYDIEFPYTVGISAGAEVLLPFVAKQKDRLRVTGVDAACESGAIGVSPLVHERSEERRVGKECLRLCRSRWSPYH